MEIKKGISQMAEYPNVEINYVMSRDGRMYYVLKDGILENGCIIATLDPKYAIDEKIKDVGNSGCNDRGYSYDVHARCLQFRRRRRRVLRRKLRRRRRRQSP